MIGKFLARLDLAAKAPIDRLHSVVREFRRIPYENLTKIISFGEKKVDPFRDTDEVLEGFLRDGAGGTCFSIVNALRGCLSASGIETRVMLADRHYGPNTHCALMARLEGREWLLDPGFLVFEPIAFPGGRCAAPQGAIEWNPSGDRVEAVTVYPNGHRKSRYHLRPVAVSEDDFRGAWTASFAFEMMQYPVVTQILEDGRHVYLKNGHWMVNGRYVESLSARDLPGRIASLGIKSSLAKRALQILGKA